MANFGVIMAGLGIVLAFIGIIFLICTLVSFIKVRSFSKCSESITGRVGNKYVHHGKNQRFYSMDIKYTVDGIEYKRSVPASLSEHDTLKEGDPFEIKYRADKPKKIIRADNMSEQSAKKLRTLLIISVVMTVVGAAMVLIRILTVRT